MTSLWALLLSAVLAAPLLGELWLAVALRRHAPREPAARLTFVLLLAHATTLLPLALVVFLDGLGVDVATVLGVGFEAAPFLLAFVGLGFAPAFSAAVALSFPTLHRRLRGDASWIHLWFVPPVYVGGVVAVFATLALALYPRPVVVGPWWISLPSPAALLGYLLLFVVVFSAVGLAVVMRAFTDRWERARSASQALRIRSLSDALTVPLAAGTVATGFLLYSLFYAGGTTSPGYVIFVGFLVAAYVVPPVALASAILRYRVWDWTREARRGIRFTLSGGLIGFATALVIFFVSEVAESVLTFRIDGYWFGIAAATVLALAARPIERAATRLTRRLVPDPRSEPADGPAHREAAYRAAYEDLVGDRIPNPEERRLLDALARGLRLEPVRAAAIEAGSRGGGADPATPPARPGRPLHASRPQVATPDPLGSGRPPRIRTPAQAPLVAGVVAFVVLAGSATAWSAWRESSTSSGITALDAAEFAVAEARRWDAGARLVSAVGLEGSYDARWMDNATGALAGIPGGCAGGAYFCWFLSETDARVGDGKCRLWVFRFAAPARPSTFALEVRYDGRVATHDFEDPRYAGPPIENWRVDSDQALEAAMGADPGIEAAVDADDIAVLYLLSRSASGDRSTWNVYVAESGRNTQLPTSARVDAATGLRIFESSG